MKGILIAQQLEFKVEVPQDELFQGDAIECLLSVKNHSGSPRQLADLSVELAVGDLKLIRERDPEAFTIIQSATLDSPGEIPAGAQIHRTTQFSLDKNAPITDKQTSLFLLFGSRSLEGANGNLLLTIKPSPTITAVLELIESAFQFVRKGEKGGKGWVVGKFKPPATPTFARVEELHLSLRFIEEAMELRYLFKVKKFVASSESAMAVKSGKVELSQRIEPKRFQLGEGLDLQKLEAEIGAIFSSPEVTG